MSDLFTCPVPSTLAAAPNPSCPVKFDQIQKVFIRRITGRATITTATALLSATISPLLSATDDTKLLVSPWMLNFKLPLSEPLKEGGNDNTTLNGVPRLLGLPFTAVTGTTMDNVAASTAQAMRALASESANSAAGTTNLEAFFVTKDGKIIGDNPSSTTFYGFPIYNFAVTDVSSEGFNQPNKFGVSFDLAPLWSKTFAVLTPTDYNALTIVNS
jgi:hypothetical protein